MAMPIVKFLSRIAERPSLRALVFLAGSALLIFSLVWPDSARAFVDWNKLGGSGGAVGVVQALLNLGVEVLLRTAMFIVGMFLVAFGYFGLIIFTLSVIVSGWIIKVSVSIPLIMDSAGNKSWAMEFGWDFTRGLVNMLFIIILAWIGIATILRLREYQTGKIFLNLIVIALLVNFSPLLVGFFADISNLIIHFFLADIIGGGLGDFISKVVLPLGGQLARQIFNIIDITKGLADALASFAGLATYGIFFLVGSLIFWLIAATFLGRILAYWILLITAPIAFVARILPATKKYWDMWWHNLIQWTFVGIAASFFIYLSFNFLNEISQGSLSGQLGEQGFVQAIHDHGDPFTAFGVEVLGSLLPLFVSLAFLFAGLNLGFNTSAMGASMVINYARTSAFKVKDFARTRFRESKLGNWTYEKTKGWAGKDVGYDQQGTPKAGLIWGASRQVAKWTGFNWARRQIGREIGAGEMEAAERELAAAEKSVEKASVERKVSLLKDKLRSKTYKIGVLTSLAKNVGEMDEALEKGLTENELEDIYRFAQSRNIHKEIESSRPDLAFSRIKPAAMAAGQPIHQIYGEQVLGRKVMKPVRAGQVAISTFRKDPATGNMSVEGAAALEGIIRNWDQSQMSKFIENHGAPGAQIIEDGLYEATPHGTKPIDRLRTFNPRLATWIENNQGARGLFDINRLQTTK